MHAIDHGLPHDDPHNVAAALALGYTWDDKANAFRDAEGNLIEPGYNEVNDDRWGTMTDAEAVLCHK